MGKHKQSKHTQHMKLTIEIPDHLAAEVLKNIGSLLGNDVAHEEPVVRLEVPEATDRTQMELPWGDLPEPPPLPEGKTRWVYRGDFDYMADEEYCFYSDRIIYYLNCDTWVKTMHFGGNIPHIEAI